MKTCEDCGCKVYNIGCVNCNEENYISEQSRLDSLPEIYQTNSENI